MNIIYLELYIITQLSFRLLKIYTVNCSSNELARIEKTRSVAAEGCINVYALSTCDLYESSQPKPTTCATIIYICLSSTSHREP